MIRIGMIGAGEMAAIHMEKLGCREQARIVSVCDIIRDAAERAAGPFGANAYVNAAEMLDSEELDALFVCVPPFAHGEIEEQAADRGIHLMIEKPVGLGMDEVRAKSERLKESGVTVSTGYCLRYMDAVQRAKSYLADKEIAMVRAWRFGEFSPLAWWKDKQKSGGQLVETTTHNVDLMRYLVGDIRKVSADAALLLMRHVPGISIPDVTSVNMVFANGAVGHLDTSFIPQPDDEERQGLEIMGRGFRVTLDRSNLTVMDRDGVVVTPCLDDFYQAQDDAFLHAVATGDRSGILAPYEEAMRTLEATLAANASAESGLPVYLTDTR